MHDPGRRIFQKEADAVNNCRPEHYHVRVGVTFWWTFFQLLRSLTVWRRIDYDKVIVLLAIVGEKKKGCACAILTCRTCFSFDPKNYTKRNSYRAYAGKVKAKKNTLNL
jgi:hypothetical protein